MLLKMKIITIVGARPQFIKAAAVSRIIRKDNTEILVHTGQHYDPNLSDIFFDELQIPYPDYNLGVGSGSHGKQTAEMLIKIEEVIFNENPDALLVYGDTNSTLAGALAASKQLIPVAHIEAGLRSYNMAMPEEQNRVLTDHISKWLFCPTETAVANLKSEGITRNVYNVGDVMNDALLYYKQIAMDRYKKIGVKKINHIIENHHSIENGWYLATIHRAENTDIENKLDTILAAFEQLDLPVIFPIHPRTKNIAENLNAKHRYHNIHFVQPVGYLYMLYLTSSAKKVVTDSGGLQKEAYLLNVPCVTVREQTEWVETLSGNWNILCSTQTDDIINKVTSITPLLSAKAEHYGDGNAAKKICDILRKTN
jgi:UDP-GlcNAc3NAcA epimerase